MCAEETKGEGRKEGRCNRRAFTGPMSSLGLDSNEQRSGLGGDSLKDILQLRSILERVQRYHAIVVVRRGN